MQNLNLSTNLDIKTFLRWWKRELAFFIPKKMRDFFHQPQKMLVIEITETVLHFTYLNDFQNQTLPDLPRQTASSDDFKNLLSSDKNLTDCAICLRLNTMQATSKLLTLPKAAKENINQVILYELDRFTPFKANQIYFTSAQLVSSDNEQINAQILLTPRSLFDNLYSELKKLGITPEFVDVKGVENDFKQKDTIYDETDKDEDDGIQVEWKNGDTERKNIESVCVKKKTSIGPCGLVIKYERMVDEL